VFRGILALSRTLFALAWTMPVRRFITPFALLYSLDPSIADERVQLTAPLALPAMDDQLCILTVHAHPDDEASKGAGPSRSTTPGVHTVLVTCTGGGGRHPQPTMDTPRCVPTSPGASPRARSSCRDHRLHRGSPARLPRFGHARLEGELRPRSFAAHPLNETVERSWPRSAGTPAGDHHLQRRSRALPHPTTYVCRHIVAAFDASGDAGPSCRGEPYQPLKMYYSSGLGASPSYAREVLELDWSRLRRELAGTSGDDDKITTSIDLTASRTFVAWPARACHQVDRTRSTGSDCPR